MPAPVITRVLTRIALPLVIAGVLWGTAGQEHQPVQITLLRTGIRSARIEQFISDLDGDGHLEMAYSDPRTLGFVLHTEDPREANSAFPGYTIWHYPCPRGTHATGLDHLDLDGDGSDEILLGCSYGDSVLAMHLAQPAPQRAYQRIIRRGSGAAEMTVAGWSLCYDRPTEQHSLVVALKDGAGLGMLAAYLVRPSADTLEIAGEPNWTYHCGPLTGFLGSDRPDSSHWGSLCFVTYAGSSDAGIRDTLACLNGLSGDPVWSRDLGCGHGGHPIWANARDSKALIVASGRRGPDAEGFALRSYDVSGSLQSEGEWIDAPYHPPLIPCDLDDDGLAEIIAGNCRGVIRIYELPLGIPLHTSARLCDGEIRCVPFRDGDVHFLANSATALWRLDGDLGRVGEEARFEGHLLNEPLHVFDHPLWNKIVLTAVSRVRDGMQVQAYFDPVSGDPLIPQITEERGRLTVGVVLLCGILLGVLFGIRSPREDMSVATIPRLSPETQRLHLALRNFRHSQPAWRVFRGLARLLATLEQRAPDEREAVFALIEQRLATLRISSMPSVSEVVAAAERAEWRPAEIAKLRHLERELLDILQSAGGTEGISRMGLWEHASAIREAAVTIAEILEDLGRFARAERHSVPLTVLSSLLRDLRSTNTRQALQLEVEGNALSHAYIPGDILRYVLDQILHAYLQDADSFIPAIVCRACFHERRVVLSVAVDLAEPQPVQKRIGMHVDSLQEIIEPFGSQLAVEFKNGSLATDLTLEVAG